MVVIIIIVLGLIVGSFLNVVIYRLPKKQSLVYPRSYCPKCKSELKIIDLIPILSYFMNKGKCRFCGNKISFQYPLVEILTSFLFFLSFLKYGLNVEFIIYIIIISSLVCISFIDIKHQIIPNEITFLFIPLGLILSIIFSHITFFDSLLGLLVPSGLLLLIALIYQKGMGIGDVKLIGMIGVFIGWKYALISIFIGSLFGTFYGLYMMLRDNLTRKTKIPFGPFISIGALIMILYGNRLVDWYIRLFF